LRISWERGRLARRGFRDGGSPFLVTNDLGPLIQAGASSKKKQSWHAQNCLVVLAINMKTINPDDFVFSRVLRISLPDVRGWLNRQKQGDETVKAPLIRFIDHRLRGRYITPLQNVKPRKYRSGFLMMAASCLLIETLQSFFLGIKDTKDVSAKSFKAFFERNKEFFPKFSECFPGVALDSKQDNFYYNIRCGILHQAETTGSYRIVRDKSDLFEPAEQTINADKFINAVESCLDKYLNELRVLPVVSQRWSKVADKVSFICDNFEK
jgi:hypothetical protein